MFPNSCLVYASAAWDIGEMLDACQIVYGVDKTTPNSALLPVTHLRELAEENLNPKQPVNYSGNIFSEELPKGGKPAVTFTSSITPTPSLPGNTTRSRRPICAGPISPTAQEH